MVRELSGEIEALADIEVFVEDGQVVERARLRCELEADLCLAHIETATEVELGAHGACNEFGVRRHCKVNRDGFARATGNGERATKAADLAVVGAVFAEECFKAGIVERLA